MQKAQQTPGSLVWNCRIYCCHSECVKGDESEQTTVRPREILSCQRSYESDDSQEDYERFGPDGAGGEFRIEKHFEIVVPGVDMQGGATGTVEVGCVSSNRIGNPREIGQK